MKIAIATSFDSWRLSYSICHVVKAHARALSALGHTVQIWGEEHLGPTEDIGSAEVIPCFSLHTYRPDEAQPEDVATKRREIIAAFEQFKPDLILAHDLIFQSSFVAYAEALHGIGDSLGCLWFHLVHSNVGTGEPVTAGNRCRRSVPRGHAILALGPSHRDRLARYYKHPPDDIMVCANPCSLLSCITPEARVIADELRLLERDFVQVYPVCGTRLADKGMRWLIDTFDALDGRGQDVCLIVANANSSTAHIRQDIQRNYHSRQLGKDALIFSSERWPQWADGVPHSIVADLVRLSNLFVFPSRSEACSLALAEAQAAGCLCVLNENCTGQMDYRHQSALTFPFDGVDFKVHFHTEETTQINQDGKVSVKTRVLDEQESRTVELDKLAARIISTAEQCQPLMARRFAARTYEPRAVAKHILQLAGMAKGYQDAIAT